MLDSLSRGVFHTLAGSPPLKSLASRYGMRPRGFARRFIAGETLVDAIATATQLTGSGRRCTLNYLGESVTSSVAAPAATDTYQSIMREIHDAATSRTRSAPRTTESGFTSRSDTSGFSTSCAAWASARPTCCSC